MNKTVTNTLEVVGLEKTFQGELVLKEINLSAKKGEIITVVGPSGGGKSTLLRCIAGLEDPSAGTITINGNFGMVFQSFNLFQNLTVIENIVLALTKVKNKNKTEANEIAEKVLRKVGLLDKANSYPSRISGGQAQRAAIARMISCEPELLLFDEPTSALDPYLKSEVLDLIGSIASEKQRTIILVTHELEFAKRISDRTLQIISGEICNL